MPFEVNRFVNVTVAYHSRVIRKARYFECFVFLFATNHRHIFALLGAEGEAKSLAKKFFSLLEIFLRIVGA